MEDPVQENDDEEEEDEKGVAGWNFEKASASAEKSVSAGAGRRRSAFGWKTR